MTPAQRAAIALDRGDYQEAERLALKMTRSYPRNAFGWKILGASLMLTGRMTEALKAVQNAVGLLPVDAEARHDLGIVLYALGRHKEAVESLRHAIDLRPGFPEAYNNLGNMLWELGRLKEAEAALRHAIELRPEFAIAHNNLGNALRGLGQQFDAESHYRRAIELRAGYAEAHDNLGTTLQDIGRMDDAEKHYTRAVELCPDHAEYYRNLCELKRFVPGDPFVGQLRRLHERSKDETNRMHASFALAKACEDMGEYGEAFLLYEEGNRLRKGQLAYSIEHDRMLFERIKL
nr:tetratricopeptide repeat protein [Burkholderiales bacterium]